MPEQVYQDALQVMIKRGGPYRGRDIPEFFALMEELFTPEEMALNNVMEKRPATLEAIAGAAGLPRQEVEPLLEGMANKGLCMAFDKGGVRYFAGSPFMPGIFEYQFLPGTVGERQTRIAHLIKNYKKAFRGEGPARPMTFAATRVIPVDRVIDAGNQIHTYDQMATYIDKYDQIGVGHCYCRHAGLLRGEDTHDMPIEVCMWFGPMAQYGVERLGGRLLSKTEAMTLLNDCEKAGLIHMSRNTSEDIDFVCNCDRWHCEVVTSVLEQAEPARFFNSGYQPEFDAELCVACGVCLDRCPPAAISLGEEGPPTVDLTRCFGCAVCATGCASEAITMQTKPGFPPPPKDTRELKEAIMASRQQG